MYVPPSSSALGQIFRLLFMQTKSLHRYIEAYFTFDVCHATNVLHEKDLAIDTCMKEISSEGFRTEVLLFLFFKYIILLNSFTDSLMLGLDFRRSAVISDPFSTFYLVTH
jgi:hypothetical protein